MTTSAEVGRFEIDSKIVIGRLENDQIHVVSEIDELRKVIAGMPESLATTLWTAPLSGARTLATLDPDARVFAIAVNYHAHGAEAARTPPPRPLAFYKAPSNFVGQGAVLDSHPELTRKFDYEGEIGLVISRPCYQVTREAALDYVAGICAVNDGSARDLTSMQAGETRWVDWTAAKALDNASAIGPVISCGPEVIAALDQGTLTFETRLNGEVVQQGRLAELIFSPRDLIAVLSSYMTLLPGDVIATGTPAGVGMGTGRFLRTGDQVEIHIANQRPLQFSVG